MSKDPSVNTHHDQSAIQHTLPGWVLWVQEHLMLSFLIIAEAYILGNLMTIGWVKSIEEPATWGWFNGLGVVLFFAAGMTAAGIGLRCSITAAAAFARRSWGFGLFNLFGLTVFTIAEIWASLSERSANLQPTPADNAVLNLLDVAWIHLSPTVVIVAVLLPFCTFFWGFSQAPTAPQETPEQRANRQQKEEEELAHKLRLQQMRAGGIATTLRAATTALIAKQDDGSTVENTHGIDGAIPGQTGEEDSTNSGDKPGRSPSNNRGKGGKGGSANMGIHAVPTGMWTRTNLQEFAQGKYGVTISDSDATRIMNTLGNGTRLEGLVGQPYAAPRATVMAWVNKQYGQVKEGGQAEQQVS